MTDERDYRDRLAAESAKWGDHMKVEASGEWHAWLDHPVVAGHYHRRALIDGLQWEPWITRQLGGPAEIALDLGCGIGSRGIAAYEAGTARQVEGYDVSEERIAEAERSRAAIGIPGRFHVADINTLALPANRYDLIFSCHSFHHFLDLEHIMAQVERALTPRGYFVLEEYVGPTQFQWTDEQMSLVRALLALVPPELRRLRWDAVKDQEGRPRPEDVVAVSPFESIRSADIYPLFREHFDVAQVRCLGGTLQHLLYNGIVHNFHPGSGVARRCVEAIIATEDALIDGGMLPSDFMVLVGRRKARAAAS